MNDVKYNLREIKFELTYKCPLKCIHCSSEADVVACEMSYEVAVDILSQAIDMGVQEISFSGGEPLLWPKFSEVASLCSSAGIYTQVYSSGNLGGLRIFEEVKDSIDNVIFSIYSSYPKAHEQITKVEGSFENTISAVEEAKSAGINVEFHFVPLKPNYEHLPKTIVFAEKLGVSKISVLRFVPQGRGEAISGLALNKKENLKLKNFMENNNSEVQLRTGSPYNFLMVNQKPKCNAAIDRLTITPDLRIYPCDAFKQVTAEKFIDLDEYSRLDKWTLKDCWSKSTYFNTIRKYHQQPFENPCNNCGEVKACLSGCVAQKYLASGILAKGPDPMCLKQ